MRNRVQNQLFKPEIPLKLEGGHLQVSKTHPRQAFRNLTGRNCVPVINVNQITATDLPAWGIEDSPSPPVWVEGITRSHLDHFKGSQTCLLKNPEIFTSTIVPCLESSEASQGDMENGGNP